MRCWYWQIPGSSKTLSSRRRIKYLIEQHHVKPEDILVITFTKAAAEGDAEERFAINSVREVQSSLFWYVPLGFFQIFTAYLPFYSAEYYGKMTSTDCCRYP